jgi:Fur family ferric uptake transcriptional regulator
MSDCQPVKLTKQRRIILEELQRVQTHPSANEMYALVRRRLPRISLATVYRNLELLAAAGMIQKLGLSGSQRRFDGQVHNHYHIRCLECERVEDMPLAPLPVIDENSVSLENYQIVGHRLEFFGICPRCQGKALDSDARPPEESTHTPIPQVQGKKF